MANIVIIKTEKDEEKLITKTIQLDQSIYTILESKGPITRGELAKITGIARSTLYDSLSRLIIKKRAKKESNAEHITRGRPKIFFDITR